MEKLVEKLEDKIREIQENRTETEELGVNEDTINGYIKGINHAISVVKDYETEKAFERLFFDMDKKEIKTEKEIREMFFREEVYDLLNNCSDYLDNYLDLEQQFECIRIAKNGNITEIIDRLNSLWNYSIEEIILKGE